MILATRAFCHSGVTRRDDGSAILTLLGTVIFEREALASQPLAAGF
jgi:hypothetical protein